MSKYKGTSPNHNSKYKCNFEIMSFKINGTDAIFKWLLQAGRQAGVEAGNKSAWNPSAQCTYRNTNIALQLCIHTPDFPETAFPTFVENGFVSCPPNFHRQQELPLLVSTN